MKADITFEVAGVPITIHIRDEIVGDSIYVVPPLTTPSIFRWRINEWDRPVRDIMDNPRDENGELPAWWPRGINIEPREWMPDGTIMMTSFSDRTAHAIGQAIDMNLYMAGPAVVKELLAAGERGEIAIIRNVRKE